MMCLRHCRDVGELQPLLKQSYHIRRREEDDEAILASPLYLSQYERGHLWGAGLGLFCIGDGGLQRLGQPRTPHVIRYALLHIDQDQSCVWVLHPLGQDSQCIPFITSKERQKGGCGKDFPSSGLSHNRQVLHKWVYGREVGCL